MRLAAMQQPLVTESDDVERHEPRRCHRRTRSFKGQSLVATYGIEAPLLPRPSMVEAILTQVVGGVGRQS